ncbi:MAG TPA: sigma-70 family RNA polymerase sigma factor [Puia sp.]|jgi:RNA polymerase sigma-70 factor (ECF subfamily)
MRNDNSSREDDRQVISLLMRGGLDKRKGENVLFGRYAYFIREGTRKFGLSEEDAFSAYSDSVLAAVDKIRNEAFKGESSLKTWLYQIFRNKCVDLFRRNSTDKNSINRAQSISEQLLYISDKARSIVQQLIEKADWRLLKERLNGLSDDCRRMLLLWADNHSDREIAAELGFKTADVAKTSRLRCLEKLRRVYNTR